MDNEVIERCKAELERCFAPAIDFSSPYAKVMSDMAVKAIIKAMRKPTNKMLIAGSEENPTIWNDETDDGFSLDVSNDVWTAMIDMVINEN